MNDTEKFDVLLVDDRQENLLALEGLLEGPDLNIVKATSGNEALGLTLEHDFAVVLMDVQMPEMDGFETAELMRGTEKTRHIPIIFVTAISREPQNVFKGYDAGAVDYLIKPVDPSILGSKVQVFLELYKQKKSLEKTAEDLKRTVEQLNTEIVERKRGQEALKARESLLRKILEKNADGIIIVDKNERVLFVNPSAEAFFGRKAEELRGELCGFPLVTGETAELSVVRSEGEKAIAEVRMAEIDWEGESAYLASLRDVTEIYKARKRVELLAHLVENARHVMIFIASPDGQIVECNALARSTFGYVKSEMLRKNIGSLFAFGADGDWESIAAVVQQDSHWRGGLVAACKDGGEFPVDMAASRSEKEETEGGNIICFVRDVSREKEIDRMKSEFISMASHEMRTPMTSIKNAIDIMLKKKAGDITDTQENFLSMASRNIDRLASLINDLLDISKIEAGRMELSYSEVDMKESIQNLISTSRPLAEAKSITLETAVPPDLPTVYADGFRIDQVLINLVGNAIKFTPDNGVVKVAVRQMQEAPGTAGGGIGLLEILVTDNGVGIPEGGIEYIFDKFYQVESSLSAQKQGGSGLGLAISKHLVEAHGGEIRCESKEGEGSTFSFTIPVVDREQRLYRSLDGDLHRAKQETSVLSILLFKIEELAHFIEEYGQQACETLLKAVQDEFIEHSVKKTDKISLSPPNGEILLVLPNTDNKGAQVVQERIKGQITGKSIEFGGTHYRPSFAAVVASFPEHGGSAKELVEFGRGHIERRKNNG